VVVALQILYCVFEFVVVTELAIHKSEMRLKFWLHGVSSTLCVADGNARVVVVSIVVTPRVAANIKLTAVDVQHPITIGIIRATECGGRWHIPEKRSWAWDHSRARWQAA
jgi:hypothetical protein